MLLCFHFKEIMSQISVIKEILRNEKLPDYLKASAETAKCMIKFFYVIVPASSSGKFFLQ